MLPGGLITYLLKLELKLTENKQTNKQMAPCFLLVSGTQEMILSILDLSITGYAHLCRDTDICTVYHDCELTIWECLFG